ncbi:integrator complex subunit 8 isoform X2 [Cylas formicarius]|uniref:integrator complex subunit 8 isoform X2 n=1 Tax=Cylas formicarius TaxID=197179 RepID=UPI002958684C|nr:integrator complex subunit 8 isoform X2 [Cylas formicarius]
MDVDLLRPGTVPISPDTVLGFEFLLDKNLLLKHLQKPNSDPSPTGLITKFHDVMALTLCNKLESENPETINSEASDLKVKHPAKNIAMKILSLKVAAYLNWNLSQIRTLPFKTQINLLQDLMYFTSEEQTVMEIPNIEQTDTRTASPQFLFSLLLFHRWLLNTSMHRVTSNWQQRYGMNDMSPADENIICCHENIQKTLTFLIDALQWEDIPCMLTFDCFNTPTEQNDNIEFDWSKGQSITKEEFGAQISYDLGTFYFYQEDYNQAKEYFLKCLEYFNTLDKNNGFLNFDKAVLEVFVRACDPTVDTQKRSLLEQLSNSIVNQYMGITGILQQDNIEREIPLIHRINLELDIQGALSSGAFTVARDLLFKVKALNHAIQTSWRFHQEIDRNLLKNYLFELIIKEEVPELLSKIQSNEVLGNIFQKSEMQFITERENDRDVTNLMFHSEFNFFESTKKRKPKMDLRQLQQKLISTYNCKEIKDILLKMGAMNLGKSVSEINPLWQLPIPLQSVIKSLPRGLLQDYAYVLLAKSKEHLLNKNWNLALELLIVLDKELQTATCNVSKLSRMVNWEVLLIQITQFWEDWPRASVDKNALANACETCLHTNESVIPRTEIIESCAICLLNLGRWEFLINYEKRWSTFEITSAIAQACHEVIKNKGIKKFSKNLWEIVLPVFAPNSSQSKRSNSGYLDSSNIKNNLMSIFFKLKDSWCLTVVISLLTKMFNIVKDETNLELQVDYANLWPSVISNASSYNVAAVSEMLSEVLSHGLKDYPTNIHWLRLLGDINFANGNYKISLSFYLKSLLICSDYFNIPVRNDDHVFRRMIKCCQAMGCSTQAAVLCQFLEEPDYTLAFRILSEQKTCNDAVDAYYHCFWDTNILEFLIYIHNRRGEFQRRKAAVQVIGMLELNSNNNEEIQREASNLRKSVFLRALCKQYVF